MAATLKFTGWLPHVVRLRARGTVWWTSGGVIEHCDYEALVSDVSRCIGIDNITTDIDIGFGRTTAIE